MPSKEEMAKAIGDDLMELLRTEAAEIGQGLKEDLTEVSEYAASRTQHLSAAISEPGFPEALRAERDNVALMAAMEGVDRADDLDQRLLSVTNGALAIGARAISLIA